MTLWQLLAGRSASTKRYCPYVPTADSSGPVAVIVIRFAAVAGAREICGDDTGGPGLRIAAGGDVVKPDARQYPLAASGPAVRNKLANRPPITKDGAAGGAWGIDSDIGAAHGAHRGARSIHRLDRHTVGPVAAR
jgi:hypothetical protein